MSDTFSQSTHGTASTTSHSAGSHSAGSHSMGSGSRFRLSGHQERVFQQAQKLYQDGIEWRDFYREVLGPEGLLRRMFGEEEYAEFENTDAFDEIHQMMANLREKTSKRKRQKPDDEPIKVITVRLPQSLHESLRAEAHGLQTSMNQLCIAKLLRAIDDASEGDSPNGRE